MWRYIWITSFNRIILRNGRNIESECRDLWLVPNLKKSSIVSQWAMPQAWWQLYSKQRPKLRVKFTHSKLIFIFLDARYVPGINCARCVCVWVLGWISNIWRHGLRLHNLSWIGYEAEALWLPLSHSTTMSTASESPPKWVQSDDENQTTRRQSKLNKSHT